MPEIEVDRGLVRELNEIDSALRRALGEKYSGAVMNSDKIRLVLLDTASPEEMAQARSLALSEIAKVDPLQPAPSVQRKQRVTTATQALKAVDFADVKTQIEAISTLPQAKTMLLKLARAVWQLAVIMSLNEQDEEA